jgi:hypothetical protein
MYDMRTVKETLALESYSEDLPVLATENFLVNFCFSRRDVDGSKSAIKLLLALSSLAYNAHNSPSF